MEFNPDKCEVINISNKRSHVYHDYNIHGKILAHVTHAKYLGLTFSTNMTSFMEQTYRHHNQEGKLHLCLPATQHQQL